MPLIGKEKLNFFQLPADLDPNTEVFYCETTGEAFLTYEEFFQRQAYCSTPQWTCTVTGKCGLTYQEALQSEKESQNLLSSIPQVLQKVLLHLMTYMDNFSANVTIALLIEYTNLRYFIGEEVHVNYNKSQKLTAIVRDVIPPDEEEKPTSIAYGIDPLKYHYVVEYVNLGSKKAALLNGQTVETIAASRITRPKCLLNREKIRLFIKQHLSPKGSRYEALSIKEESIRNLELDTLKWEEIFKGPVPNFCDDTTIVKTAGKDDSGTIEKVPIVKKKGNILAQQKLKQKKREEKLKKGNKKKEKLAKRKEAKLKGSKKAKKAKGEAEQAETKQTQAERKKAEKEAKRKFEEHLRSYNEKRDDLLCDDLKPLPIPIKFDCGIESQLIGDSLGIIEFLNMFKEHLNILDIFPEGVAFEMFVKILNDCDVDGPYYDLLRSLLHTLLMSKIGDAELEGDLVIDEANDNINALHEDEEVGANSYVNFANHWVSTYFGTHEQLSKLKIDAFTLTEILRIYIQKAHKGERRIKAKRQAISDEDAHLITRLTLCSVFELNQAERVQLLNLLILDVGKIPDIRTKMEESVEEVYRLKNQIRHIKGAYTRWLRDHPIRAKMRKKKADAAAASAAAAAVGSGEDKDAEPSAAVDDDASAEEREQFQKDKSVKEQQTKRSLAELKSKIRKLNSVCRPRPLGVDRAFRRYWIFQSMPGILVEHPIEEALCLRPCLEEPTIQVRPQLSNYLPNARRKKSKAKSKESQNGNNNPSTSSQMDAATSTPSKSNQQAGTEPQETAEGAPMEVANAEEVPSIGDFDRCTGDNSTCAVHGASKLNQRVLWCFYTKDHIVSFLEALSNRGLRESELRATLELEVPTILKNHLERFNPTIYNHKYVPPLETIITDDNGEVRKSERILNQMVEKAIVTLKTVNPAVKHVRTPNQYSNLSPFKAQVNALRDLYYRLEANIGDSCFTSMKSDERDEWFRKMEIDFNDDQHQAVKNFIDLLRQLAMSLKPLCLLSPLAFQDMSAVSSPSDKENIDSTSRLPTSLKIPKLSDKWLDILKFPESFDPQNPQINDFESSYGILSFSQLFINVYILEKSINWDLSAMITANKCKVCRRKANEQMILCDFCNKGYHIYCLSPPINSVEEVEGDWFCPICLPRPSTSNNNNAAYSKTNNKAVDVVGKLDREPKPAAITNNKVAVNGVKPATPNPPTSKAAAPEPDDFAELLKCPICKKHVVDEYAEVICKTCNHNFHLHCASLHRVPRAWNCSECEAKIKCAPAATRYAESVSVDEGAEVRRSSRKRKPNNYFDDAEDNNDKNYYARKTRRYSEEDDDENELPVAVSYERAKRPRREAANNAKTWNDDSNDSY